MSEELATVFKCPACGNKVAGLEKSCPNCGLPFDESVKFDCPFCGARVSPGAASCHSCKAEFRKLPSAGEQSPIASAVSEILSDIESLEKGSASAEIRALEDMLAKAKETIEGTADRAPGICPVCKSSLPTNETRCPVCSAHAAEQERLSAERALNEIEQMAAKEGASQGEAGPAQQAEGLRARAELLRAKQGAVAVDAKHLVKRQRKLRGLSNGIGTTNGLRTGREGRINGMHLVNGKGAVNGRSMVNGTGILNGLKPRGGRARTGLGRIHQLTSWQFLAVLTAIIIVIPTMILLQGTGSKGPYTIDGNFDEWADSTRFGILVSSAAPAINVTEWSVGLHSSYLYVYLRTESNTMSGSSPQRFILFIDSDDSESTGYAVGGVGADLMLEVMGWNGSVGQSALSEFSGSQDQRDWSQWRYSRGASCEVVGPEVEVGVELPFEVQQSSRLVLTSQDEYGPGCVSSAVVMSGSLLVIEQMPGLAVQSPGTLRAVSQSAFLRLRFSCEGSGGTVQSVAPTLVGIEQYQAIPSFALSAGQERTVDLLVDASTLSPGDFVSAVVEEDGISSTFTKVQLIGDGAKAYIESPPPSISIDGAFADWDGLKHADIDDIPVANPNVDIDEVGGVATSEKSFFYVSVQGEMLSGTYVPKLCVIPSGGGGGGGVIPARRTAEDFARVYVDADRSDSTGKVISAGETTIGADYMIEIKGLYSTITSRALYRFDGQWIDHQGVIEAAKDAKRMEIGIDSAVLGNASAIDFLVETTDWIGDRDLASIDPYGGGTRRWVVDPASSSALATSMSYQRKLFFDGTNYWSFYFDGSNTVHKYSVNGGMTWTSAGSVFKTSGVREVSIWFDHANNIVYAVGDTSTSSLYVRIQRGSVSPSTHTITWAASDSTLTVSTRDLPGKNTFICKDANGYLWILASNCSAVGRYKLSAYISASTDSITQWSQSGEMPSAQGTTDQEVRGSIVPAGSGSNVWSIFADGGAIYSKKYTGTWPVGVTEIYGGGAATDNHINAAPSVVVDSKGVVHVVYGDGTQTGGVSTPFTNYVHNNTGQTTWSTAIDLDSGRPDGAGDKYPTISLDRSSGDLYVFWARTDSSGTPQTIIGKKKSGGSWSGITIDNPNTLTKQHLSSAYSVADDSRVCWQWTQNTTGTIQVIFDRIPEFDTLALPIVSLALICCALNVRARASRGRREKV
jgi:uncharacterized Zn finger protein (UPF0148 family)